MPSTSQRKRQVKESAMEKATSPSPTTTDDTFVTCLEIESATQAAIPAPVLARGTVAEDGEGGARKKGKKKKGSGKAEETATTLMQKSVLASPVPKDSSDIPPTSIQPSRPSNASKNRSKSAASKRSGVSPAMPSTMSATLSPSPTLQVPKEASTSTKDSDAGNMSSAAQQQSVPVPSDTSAASETAPKPVAKSKGRKKAAKSLPPVQTEDSPVTAPGQAKGNSKGKSRKSVGKKEKAAETPLLDREEGTKLSALNKNSVMTAKDGQIKGSTAKMKGKAATKTPESVGMNKGSSACTIVPTPDAAGPLTVEAMTVTTTPHKPRISPADSPLEGVTSNRKGKKSAKTKKGKGGSNVIPPQDASSTHLSRNPVVSLAGMDEGAKVSTPSSVAPSQLDVSPTQAVSYPKWDHPQLKRVQSQPQLVPGRSSPLSCLRHLQHLRCRPFAPIIQHCLSVQPPRKPHLLFSRHAPSSRHADLWFLWFVDLLFTNLRKDRASQVSFLLPTSWKRGRL
ncbi:hypothetical protein BT69DRAFT_262204 [Atractiella rhizophila]|nr:hypothetical protein BT69DRAFT_262204 [Atractiella rhizophila]